MTFQNRFCASLRSLLILVLQNDPRPEWQHRRAELDAELERIERQLMM